MNWLARGLTSSVGLKLVMAVTGLFLALFLVGHMLGNLQVFLGPEALNAYAAKLQGLGGLLWVIRLGLFSVFAVHVATGVTLWLRNRRARPVPYAGYAPLQSTLFSRTMIWTGVLIFAFLGYHLLHFTLHATNPAHVVVDEEGHVDVYRMVVLGFRDPGIALSYVAAMILLGFHLIHGIGSLFQSMGWNHRKYAGFYQALGKSVAVVLVVGNVAMPMLLLLQVAGSLAGEGGQ